MPHYKHETCGSCVFKETVKVSTVTFDVYVCPGNVVMGNTIIARWGDARPDYMSLDAGVMRFARESARVEGRAAPEGILYTMMDKHDVDPLEELARIEVTK